MDIERKMKIRKLFSIPLAIVFFSASVFGFGNAYNEYKEKEEYGIDAINVTAKVSRIEEGSYEYKKGKTYFVYIEYDCNGKTYENLYDRNAGKYKYEIGEEIPLSLHPDDPTNFLTPKEDITISIIYSLIFLGFSIFFIVLFVNTKKWFVEAEKADFKPNM